MGTVVYSVALATVVFFTRRTGRRFAGALAGAAVVAGLGLWVLIPLGEARGWCASRQLTGGGVRHVVRSVQIE